MRKDVTTFDLRKTNSFLGSDPAHSSECCRSNKNPSIGSRDADHYQEVLVVVPGRKIAIAAAS